MTQFKLQDEILASLLGEIYMHYKTQYGEEIGAKR